VAVSFFSLFDPGWGALLILNRLYFPICYLLASAGRLAYAFEKEERPTLEIPVKP
jgi:hypothetical protein